MDRRARWNERYRGRGPEVPAPSGLVELLAPYVRPGMRGVDVACGLGADAEALHARGVRMHAWDYAHEAIAKLRARVPEVRAEVRDVVASPPGPESFDLVVSVHFLERALFPQLVAALKPGGLLAVQTFLRGGRGGPSNPAFRLAPGELAELVTPLEILELRELGEAAVVARRR